MVHIVGSKQVFCPLCDEPMSRTKVNVRGKIFEMVFCRPDKVFCYTIDPAFDKWRDTDKKIECPGCASPMKWFARYIDGYMKMVCPTCGMGYEKFDDMEIRKGQIELPDYMENQAPDEDMGGQVVYIPIDKMNVSEDKKRQYKAKLKRGRRPE